MRTFAISDIHGYGHLLKELLSMANYRAGQDKLILLGDYVHKGPDSLGTLEIIYKLKEEGAIALRGNHEEKVIHRQDEKYEEIFSDEWIKFLHELPLWHEDEHYIYVHAGIRHGVDMNDQTAEDLTTIREEFYFQKNDLDKIIVFGHTPTYKLGAPMGEVWWQTDKIGIDTGVAKKLSLTLVDLTNRYTYKIEINEN